MATQCGAPAPSPTSSPLIQLRRRKHSARCSAARHGGGTSPIDKLLKRKRTRRARTRAAAL
ncbi:hypothetical protein CK203_088444 [Vitis vinifera]|uniref:Uncharacterized protein n=1 Tax=Vitis vinifera TaxID=29760 RepID=A0A438ELF4_VITVI|nr:hypothetical protein CK203_088444 [Vitis vinifera]